MKGFALALCALVALASPVTAGDMTPSAPATGPAVNLAKPFAATLGDMIAFTMTQHMVLVKAMNPSIQAPVMFSFDHASQTIVVSVYGDPNASSVFGGNPASVDQAKGALEMFRNKVFPLLTTVVSKTYGVNLSESDLTLVYIDRTAGMKEVLRREGGRYLVAD